MPSEDITWRNILLMFGSTIALGCSVTVFIMQQMTSKLDKRYEVEVKSLQQQIDIINDRLNATYRDLE